MPTTSRKNCGGWCPARTRSGWPTRSSRRHGHLPAEKVERIIAGQPTSFEDSREEIVYQLASALVAPRIVPLGLYKRAKELIGAAGIVDVTVLIGWFTMVSATLNAFDVPANAVGLDQ
jgi:4-carboxymuconolactone decarboxylase